jgi:aspartate/methionine/tyrosine aminotransferase
VNKLAEFYGQKLGRKINPLTEIVVGPGANHSINNILMALIDPALKEEVAIFEPCWP